MQSLKKIHAWAQMKVSLSITRSISKIFTPNFVCVLTNKIYKTYRMGVSFSRLGTWGYGVKHLIFPNMVMWHIK